MAAIEAPGMIARIPLIGKLSSAAIPFQSYFVFGHVSYMERGQAPGNHLLSPLLANYRRSEGKRTRRRRANPTQRISRMSQKSGGTAALSVGDCLERAAAGILVVYPQGQF
jgi:hypothetical protein